jgi:hypothetical protein
VVLSSTLLTCTSPAPNVAILPNVTIQAFGGVTTVASYQLLFDPCVSRP